MSNVSLLHLLSSGVWRLLWLVGVYFPLLADNVGGWIRLWRFVFWGWSGWEWDLCKSLGWVGMSCGGCLWGVMRWGVVILCLVGTVLRGCDLGCVFCVVVIVGYVCVMFNVGVVCPGVCVSGLFWAYFGGVEG